MFLYKKKTLVCLILSLMQSIQQVVDKLYKLTIRKIKFLLIFISLYMMLRFWKTSGIVFFLEETTTLLYSAEVNFEYINKL